QPGGMSSNRRQTRFIVFARATCVESAAMTDRGSTEYDAETIELLRAVLEEAWDALSPRLRDRISKSHMAQCVLKHAASGERHPGGLRSQAIADVVRQAA